MWAVASGSTAGRAMGSISCDDVDESPWRWLPWPLC